MSHAVNTKGLISEAYTQLLDTFLLNVTLLSRRWEIDPGIISNDIWDDILQSAQIASVILTPINASFLQSMLYPQGLVCETTSSAVDDALLCSASSREWHTRYQDGAIKTLNRIDLVMDPLVPYGY